MKYFLTKIAALIMQETLKKLLLLVGGTEAETT